MPQQDLDRAAPGFPPLQEATRSGQTVVPGLSLLVAFAASGLEPRAS